jgi:hypothetical protein
MVLSPILWVRVSALLIGEAMSIYELYKHNTLCGISFEKFVNYVRDYKSTIFLVALMCFELLIVFVGDIWIRIAFYIMKITCQYKFMDCVEKYNIDF